MMQINYSFKRLHYFSRSITMNRALNVCINFLGITILNTTFRIKETSKLAAFLALSFQKSEFAEDNFTKYQLVEGWSISKITFAKLNDKGMISLSILALDRCKYFSTCIEIKRHWLLRVLSLHVCCFCRWHATDNTSSWRGNDFRSRVTIRYYTFIHKKRIDREY